MNNKTKIEKYSVNYNSIKIRNSKILKIFLLFSILFLINLGVSTVSGAESVLNINEDMDTDTIQNIIKYTANDGDTLNFTGKNYNNMSIEISKNLTIKGNNATLSGYKDASSCCLNKNNGSVFYFNEGGSGSTLTNINIVTNVKNGILIEGTDITITNVKISGSSEYGILFYGAKEVTILNSFIAQNALGIALKNSEHITLLNNTITKNSLEGILIIESSKYINILNNNISANTNGIHLNTSTSYNIIKGNWIVGNIISSTNSVSGNGILFGSNYKIIGGEDVSIIQYNAIYDNARRNIKPLTTSLNVTIDYANWYGSNSVELANLCACIVNKQDVPLITMSIIKNQNNYQVVFLDGTTIATELAKIPISLTLDGESQMSLLSKSGTLTINYSFNPKWDYTVSASSGNARISSLIEATDPTSSLKVVESVDKTSITNGDKVTFKVLVTNNGSIVANNVNIKDILPSGFKSYTVVTTKGTYNSKTGLWNINTLNRGETATIIIIATVSKSGKVLAMSSASATGLNNNVYENINSKSNKITITVKKNVKISQSQKINKKSVKKGGSVQINVKINNNGLDNSNKLTIYNKLPKGLKSESMSPKYKSGSKWKINVAKGKTITLTMKIKANKKGKFSIPLYINNKKVKTVVLTVY